MKLENTTDFPDRFLRRAVLWVCKELEVKQSRVRLIRFGNRRLGWSGRTWRMGGRVHIRIGQYNGTLKRRSWRERTSDVVSALAHELWHVKSDTRRGRDEEANARAADRWVRKRFDAQADQLFQKWMKS
jgi:hypothetical protein